MRKKLIEVADSPVRMAGPILPTFFRARRDGPEMQIENAVVQGADALFPSNDCASWTAVSLPIGAGMPDVLIVKCEPQLFELPETKMPVAEVLAYLRSVRRAGIKTIVDRVNRSEASVGVSLSYLVRSNVIFRVQNSYSLRRVWREILPEVISIEAKVTDWNKALSQASRNCLFSHQSYVALPTKLAHRIKDANSVQQLGVGVLAVDEDQRVTIVRRSRQFVPRIWHYYYQLAFSAATHYHGGEYAIHRSDPDCSVHVP